MPLYTNTYTNQQSTEPAGTLQSNNLYFNPSVPRQSQARGISGTDDRAYTGSVQGNELVSNQLNQLLGKDSLYMQNARQRGFQQASRRGLGNSSIAAEASQRAAIESGLPIAQADAQTYFQTRAQNQADLNQNLMQERDIANRMLESSRSNQSQLALADMQRQIADADRAMRLQLQRENLAYEGEQRGLDRQQQEMMERLGFDLTDRLSQREWVRTIGRDNNTFSNQRYDALMAYDMSQLNNNSDFLRTLILEDPSIDPNALSGLYDFLDSIGQRYFPDLLSRYFGG